MSAVRFDEAHVGSGDDRGTVTTALGVEDAPGDASGVEGLEGLAEHRPVLGWVAEPVRSLTEVIPASQTAANHCRPAFVLASIADEGEVLLPPGTIGQGDGYVGLLGWLNRRELHAPTDVGVPPIHRLARAVGNLHILHDEVLRHGRRLPQAGCGVGSRNAVIGNTERSRGREAGCLARPALLNSVQDHAVFCGASLSIADHVRSGGGCQHLRAASDRARCIQLLAVQNADCVRHQHNVLAGRHGLGLGINGSTNDHAFRQGSHVQRGGDGG